MNTGFIMPIAIGTVVVALLALLPLFADGYGVSLSIGVLNYAVLATAWAMFSGPTRYNNWESTRGKGPQADGA